MPFDLNKFTESAQKSVLEAVAEAKSRGNTATESIHLLYAMASDKSGLAAKIFGAVAVDPSEVIEKCKESFVHLPRLSSRNAEVQLSIALASILDEATKIAVSTFKDDYTSVEHILLAILRARGDVGSQILFELGITEERLLRALKLIRGNQRVSDQNPETKFAAIERYGIDLTEKARSGKLNPIIGRDDEIRRVITIL